MNLSPDYVWSKDIIALRNERRDLFLKLDGALSMHAAHTVLAPFFHELYTWLRARLDAQQADLPPERRVPKSVLESRGDDVLEGFCVANSTGAGHMDQFTADYFLAQVRPRWQRICVATSLIGASSDG